MLRLIFMTLFCLMSSPAWATPPRVIVVEETILGENEIHIFLLRSVNDNLGYYITGQTDIVLIARNLATGHDDTTWRVMSVVDYGAWYKDYEQSKRVENLGAKDRVNPFDVLLWRGAGRVLPRKMASPGVTARITEGGVEIINKMGQMTHRVGLGDATSQLENSFRNTRELMPFPKPEYADDPLGMPVDIPGMCQVGPMHRYTISVNPDRDGYAARLECAVDGEITSLSVYVVVPMVK